MPTPDEVRSWDLSALKTTSGNAHAIADAILRTSDSAHSTIHDDLKWDGKTGVAARDKADREQTRMRSAATAYDDLADACANAHRDMEYPLAQIKTILDLQVKPPVTIADDWTITGVTDWNTEPGSAVGRLPDLLRTLLAADAKWGTKIADVNDRLEPLAPQQVGDPNANLNPNRKNAVEFADRYAVNPSGLYTSQPNDCTNFASEVLEQGGFREDTAPHIESNTTDRWFSQTLFGTPSKAWDNADGLHTYISNNGGAGNGGPTGKDVATQRTVPGIANPNALSQAGLKPGDLVFYDWGEGEGISHTAVYVGKDWYTRSDGTRVYGDVVDYHTNNNYHKPWALPDDGHPGDPVTYHFVHMNYPGD